MGVFKEIQRADGTGLTTFYRLNNNRDTVETDSDDVTDTMFDYNDTLNKPTINGVPLVGDKTLEELGIQPAGDYLTEIPGEYITEEELLAYEYASQDWVVEQINNVEHFHREIVDALPLVGEDNVIYLVKKEGSGEDIHNEYIWTGVDYEYIGTSAADLTDYYKKGEIDDLLLKKVNVVSGKDLSTNDFTNDYKVKLDSLENYNDAALWDAVSELHNYDDTVVVSDIAALKTTTNDLSGRTETLENTIKYKNESIHFIRSGEDWLWQNAKGDNITFTEVLDALGLAETILVVEYLETDGKILPQQYIALNDSVIIYYTDEHGYDHILTVSDGACIDDKLGDKAHFREKVDTVDNLPNDAQIGDIRLVGEHDEVYIYDGLHWIPAYKSDMIDSRYMTKDNMEPYSPTQPYNPATKQYVDDRTENLFIPTKVSQLANDSGYIKKDINDLDNYYNKNETFTRMEINGLIAAAAPAYNAGDNIIINGNTINAIDTIDYTQFINKPKINNIVINGDMLASDLNINYTDLKGLPTIPATTNELTNNSGFITNATEIDPTVPNYVKAITQQDITNWNSKSEFTGDYGEVVNKPSINNVELVGNKDTQDLHISYTDLINTPTLFSGSYNDLTNKPDIPDATSDLTNDSGFITSAALTPYAKTEAIPTKVGELVNDAGFITAEALIPYASQDDIPTKLSDLFNDEGFITNSTNELTFYYTKNEIDGMIGDINTVLATLTTVQESV